jgi:hypothetical protein
MPRYAIINAGIVENVIVANAEPAIPGRVVVALTPELMAGPRDAYSNGVFTPHAPTAAELERRAAPANRITLWQIARSRAGQLRTTAQNIGLGLTVPQQQTLLRLVADLYDFAADEVAQDARD